MRPHKILGNYGHHVGLVPDRMPSGGGCIRLVSTGPPRNHADTVRISNRTDPYSKRKAGVRVNVKLVAVLTSQGILVLESVGCEEVWVGISSI